MASKLTNKFTKSVLEREQKEQKQIETIATTPTPSPVPTPMAEEKSVTTVPVAPAAESSTVSSAAKRQSITATTPRPVKKAVAAPVMNLDAFLNPSENRQAKNKTFYLDLAVIDAIKYAATANHMAESKLVNDILKKVLGA